MISSAGKKKKKGKRKKKMGIEVTIVRQVLMRSHPSLLMQGEISQVLSLPL